MLAGMWRTCYSTTAHLISCITTYMQQLNKNNRRFQMYTYGLKIINSLDQNINPSVDRWSVDVRDKSPFWDPVQKMVRSTSSMQWVIDKKWTILFNIPYRPRFPVQTSLDTSNSNFTPPIFLIFRIFSHLSISTFR